MPDLFESVEPRLVFDRMTLRCDQADKNITNLIAWDWSLYRGERLCIISTNSFLRYQVMAILGGYVQPVSGKFEVLGSLSWPLGGEGGLDGKLTIENGLEFLLSIYNDCLNTSFVTLDDFFEALQTLSIDPSMRLKDLAKEQKDFFYMMLSVLFSFDTYLVPGSRFLMTKQARICRNLCRKQSADDKCIVTATTNNRVRREFCNRGMVLGSDGKILFDGYLEDAIAYECKNNRVGPDLESNDEDQFNAASHLTNSDLDSNYNFSI